MAGHGHCHGQCDHNHSDPAGDDRGVSFSLYTKIELDRVECLNEAVDGSGKTIFKAWDERLDNQKFVESDADEELLINVPFAGTVKLKAIVIRGANDNSHPSKLRLFKNRPNMTFDQTSLEPDQEIDLNKDPNAEAEHPLKIVKFSGISHLSLHFPSNFGEDETRIYYIGLKGDFMAAQREAILITSYESAPNPADHKASLVNSVARQIN
ncbi:putative PITH domain-containing protein [Halotydeus destructor]|nr:putative PITH domain-containing protein [Halotydeus destructor]